MEGSRTPSIPLSTKVADDPIDPTMGVVPNGDADAIEGRHSSHHFFSSRLEQDDEVAAFVGCEAWCRALRCVSHVRVCVWQDSDKQTSKRAGAEKEEK